MLFILLLIYILLSGFRLPWPGPGTIKKNKINYIIIYYIKKKIKYIIIIELINNNYYYYYYT